MTPGARPACLGMLMGLTRPCDVVLCEDVIDTGGARHPCAAGPAHNRRPKAPPLHPPGGNPATRMITLARRQGIADVVVAHRRPRIKDDTCGIIPPDAPAPLARRAPVQSNPI